MYIAVIDDFNFVLIHAKKYLYLGQVHRIHALAQNAWKEINQEWSPLIFF